MEGFICIVYNNLAIANITVLLPCTQEMGKGRRKFRCLCTSQPW